MKKGWRIIGWTVLAVVVLIVAVAVTAAYQRKALMEAAIAEGLAAYGVKDATFTVTRVADDVVTIDNLRLGPQISIKSLSAFYTLSGLAEGRVGRVRVEGLTADLSEPETGVLGLIMKTLASGDSNAGPLPPISLSDAVIHGQREGISFSARIEGDINPDLSALLTVDADGALETGGHVINGMGISADVAIEAGAKSAWISVAEGSLSDAAAVPAFPPLDMEGNVIFKDNRLDLDIALSAVAGKGRLTVRGTHDLVSKQGTAELVVAPLVFKDGGLQPADLIPGVMHISGTMAGTASVAWSGDGLLRGKGHETFSSLSFQAGEATVSGLSAVIDITTTDGLGNLEARLRDGRALIGMSGEKLEISDAQASAIIDVATQAFDFKLSRARVQSAGKSPRFAPLTVEGSGRMEDSALEFRLQGKVDSGGNVVVKGTHNLTSGKVAADITLEGLSMSADGVRMEDLSARLHAPHVTPGNPFDVTVNGLGARIFVDENRFRLNGGNATITVNPDARVAAKISGGTLSHDSPEPWFTPVAVSGKTSLGGETLGFQLRGQAGEAHVLVKGTHDLTSGEGAATVTLPPLTFTPSGLQPDDLSALVVLPGAIEGTTSGNASLTWNASGVEGKGEAALEGVSLSANGVEIKGLSAKFDFPSVKPGSPFDVTINRLAAGLGVGGERLRIEDTAVTVTLSPDTRVAAHISGGLLRHDAVEPLFAPVAFNGKADLGGDSLGFQINGAAGGGHVAVTGSHDLMSGEGEADATLSPLTFASSGPRPADLSVLLAPLEKASGTVKGESHIQWTGDGYDGSAGLVLDGLSFSAGTTSFEELRGALRLDRLNPPAIDRVQEISAARITDALSLEKPVLRFKLGEIVEGKEQIHIEHAQAEVAGGLLSVNDAVIHRSASANRLTLELSQIDLGKLMAMMDIEGVSGSGMVNGSVPLEINEDTVLIHDGLLEAAGPGVLKFHSEQAKQALASGGEPVEMLLSVLEDFRYKRLSLSLNKAEGAEADIRLSTEGANPAVKDGHPFILNVNLSSNLDKVMATLLDAYRLSDRALKATIGSER